MDVKQAGTGWLKLDAENKRAIQWFAPITWLIPAIDSINSVSTGNPGHLACNVAMLAIVSALMAGPQCYGIIEARAGSNSQKALAIITMFGSLLLFAGLITQALHLWR